MRRKPLLFAIALFVVVGAALWGVNWRLDHLPLSEADKQFRALVAGADSVQASQMSCQQAACSANALVTYKPLNAAQTRELIERLRFVKFTPIFGASLFTNSVELDLKFRRKGKPPLDFRLIQTSLISELTQANAAGAVANYHVNPRFNGALNRTLNEVLPKRIKP